MAAVGPAPLSVYNVFWLIHVVMELPMGLLPFLSPSELPLTDITPTVILLARVGARTDPSSWAPICSRRA